MLRIENLNVYVNNKKILENISFEIEKNTLVALLGPNGSGKSTLIKAILNFEEYKKDGKIFFENKDITNLPTEEIFKLGIFSVLQFLPTIEFVKTKLFLKYLGINNLEEVKKYAKYLNLPDDFLDRGLNENFSGGERKKFELLLLKFLDPKFIIFDEIDSGLDFETMKKLEEIIIENLKNGKTFLIVSHYPTIFKKIKPDKVIILSNGKIKKIGDEKLIEDIKYE